MPRKKKVHPSVKHTMHPRNKHRGRYDFEALIETCPDLETFVSHNKFDDLSIDFSDSAAVLMLNQALLQRYYGIEGWVLPEGYLCPPVPGRADYIHHAADLLASSHRGSVPRGAVIRCLDIGVGANLIYPIIGNSAYHWSFVGADIDELALESAAETVKANKHLRQNVELRLQLDKTKVFQGIIQSDELFDLTICNPPFHSSMSEARAGTLRKLRNLNKKPVKKASLNFGGQHNELVYEGGEEAFVAKMIAESKEMAGRCFWFTTLISKQAHLKGVYRALAQVEAIEVKTIAMAQGAKASRIVAWTFLTGKQREVWVNTKWNVASKS